jgi:hypothetical protein
VKPQKRDEPKLHYEDEQDAHAGHQEDMIGKENGLPPMTKQRRKHKHREQTGDSHDIDGFYFNNEYEDNVEEKQEEPVVEGSDHERRHSRRSKKKKKKQHKKRGDTPRHEDSLEYESDEDGTQQRVIEDDISSRLPPPRKLPPLRTNNADADLMI